MARALAAGLRRLARDGRGVAGVEFALVLPVLILVYATASEIALGVTADRKLRNTAAITADLVGRLNNTSAAELEGTLRIAAAVMDPFPAADTKIVASSVTIDKNGVSTVDWSVAVNGATKLAAGSPVTLPSQFADHRARSFIMVRADYPFHPGSTYGLQTVYNMSETHYLNSRMLDTLHCADCGS